MLSNVLEGFIKSLVSTVTWNGNLMALLSNVLYILSLLNIGCDKNVNRSVQLSNSYLMLVLLNF
jgi:hypothetical protein